MVVVRPGGRIPADGRVVDGSAAVDESMITGESRAVRRDVGSTVVAGTVATDSGIRVEVTATGEDTALAGSASSSPTRRHPDRAPSGWPTPPPVAVLVRPGRRDHHRGRLVPAGITRRGRHPHHHRARHRLPPRTGTGDPAGHLHRHRARGTRGRAREGPGGHGGHAVGGHRAVRQDRHPHPGPSDRDGGRAGRPRRDRRTRGRRRSGAGLGRVRRGGLRTPLARAVVRAAADRGLSVPAATGFSSSPAVGVQATVEGRTVAVGGPALLEQAGAGELPVADQWRRDGAIILHVLVDGRVAGALALADEVRAESRSAVDQLRERGVEVVMITGDAQAVAASVADQLGITRFFAGVRPEDKSATVSSLQDEGRRVAMVGDGVNDAPALAQATSASPSGPAPTSPSPPPASCWPARTPVRRLGHRPVRSHLPQEHAEPGLGRGLQPHLGPPRRRVLAPVGFVMPMSAGALLMSASTVVVALNAQLLRRLDLRPRGTDDQAPHRQPQREERHDHAERVPQPRTSRRGRTHHPNRTTPTRVPVDGSEPTRAGTPPRIGARYADGSGGPGPCAGDGGPAR